MQSAIGRDDRLRGFVSDLNSSWRAKDKFAKEATLNRD